eukprot:7112380-Lingulodinium_polyedra.AAC.1
MKNTAGVYGTAVNYSTGGASKNPFTMFPRELVDGLVGADIFGARWHQLGSPSWSEMCFAVGINSEAMSGF